MTWNKGLTKETSEKVRLSGLEYGFNVYRFWGHEINESVERCINKIFI